MMTQLRASSYTIYVDLPNEPDQMLLVHGYTGAYDKVSKRVATYVRSLERGTPPKPMYGDWTPEPPVEGTVELPTEESIRILRRRGYLTQLSEEAEIQVLRKIATTLHERSMKSPPGYIFMPSYDCNLRCHYCFQDHMRTNPLYQHLLRRMSPAIVERIFQALPQIEAAHGFESGSAITRTIGFFGGEPLVAVNRPIVEFIINKFLEIGPAKFWAVTNATELYAYEDLLRPDRIASVQITLDGPPEEHDKRRIYADGSGSFDKIARSIDLALGHGVNVSIRLNVDRGNVDQLPVLAGVMYQKHWDQSPHFSVYTAPIRASNDKVSRRDTFDTWKLDRLLVAKQKEFPELVIIGRPDTAVKDAARGIFDHPESGLPASLKETFCSAHTGMYIFDAFADIYACWERTGDASIRIGHIHENGALEMTAKIVDTWRTRTVASNPVCSSCRYALHCGGGCAVLAKDTTGTYHANYCDGFASRFRSSVAEAFVEHESGIAANARSGRLCDQ